MTDIREICSCCRQEFSPLSSARGKHADYCLGCLSAANTNLASSPEQERELESLVVAFEKRNNI